MTFPFSSRREQAAEKKRRHGENRLSQGCSWNTITQNYVSHSRRLDNPGKRSPQNHRDRSEVYEVIVKMPRRRKNAIKGGEGAAESREHSS
jgi:hypothetical protein